MNAFEGLTEEQSAALRVLHRAQWDHDMVPTPDIAAAIHAAAWADTSQRRTLIEATTRTLRTLATAGGVHCVGALRLDYADIETMLPNPGEGDVTHFVWAIAPAGHDLVLGTRRTLPGTVPAD